MQIDLSPQDLQDQASRTVNSYLYAARRAAEELDIPAKDRTAFYGAYIQACARDFQTAIMAKALGDLGTDIR